MITAQCSAFYNTPPLWENKQFEIQQFEFPSFDFQSFQPKAIPQNIRLGHQMEFVFKQLVEYSETYDVILHNLPISREKRTLGEIDFILKDNIKGKLIHVEMTYKFYIIDPEISEPIHRLIGPNRRDTFFTKMEKIKNVQFPLLHSEEGSKALYKNNINHLNIEHQCCFKAQIFPPYNDTTIDIGSLNKACVSGYWLRQNDFTSAEFTDSKFYLPTKSEWVIEPNNDVAWKSHFEILKDIDLHLKENRAPMIWQKQPNTEFNKLFVVWW